MNDTYNNQSVESNVEAQTVTSDIANPISTYSSSSDILSTILSRNVSSIETVDLDFVIEDKYADNMAVGIVESYHAMINNVSSNGIGTNASAFGVGTNSYDGVGSNIIDRVSSNVVSGLGSNSLGGIGSNTVDRVSSNVISGIGTNSITEGNNNGNLENIGEKSENGLVRNLTKLGDKSEPGLVPESGISPNSDPSNNSKVEMSGGEMMSDFMSGLDNAVLSANDDIAARSAESATDSNGNSSSSGGSSSSESSSSSGRFDSSIGADMNINTNGLFGADLQQRKYDSSKGAAMILPNSGVGTNSSGSSVSVSSVNSNSVPTAHHIATN